MNLAQLRTAVDRRTGIAQAPVACTELVNEAVQVISTERPWPWLDGVTTITTVAGTATYTLPSDCDEIRDVTIASQPARPVDVSSIDAPGDENALTFAVEGSSLILAPTPSEAVAVVVRYTKAEPVLHTDSDVPLLPASFHDLVVNKAAAIYCAARDDMTRATYFETAYERGFKRAVANARRSRGPYRIHVRPGGAI